jgi:hypothetical protein
LESSLGKTNKRAGVDFGIRSGCLKRNDSLVNEGNYGVWNEQAMCQEASMKSSSREVNPWAPGAAAARAPIHAELKVGWRFSAAQSVE